MFKTAEAVSPSHPDKICDRVSDSILDACLLQDPESRVAIECLGGHGIITITGELTTKAYVNMREIAQKITGDKYGVQVNVVQQSPEISRGVDKGGAGDQGIMVGYACKDNDEMIPHELYLARNLCKFIYKRFPEDGKTQITIDENNAISAIVASFCNVPTAELGAITRDWLGARQRSGEFTMHINPAGDWYKGGFEADTGVTGRKLACDNYGPRVPIGGGAFSGKDPSKVDRSGAYKARQVAVQLLHTMKDAIEVTVKLAYAIGVAEPVMATAEFTYPDDGREQTHATKNLAITEDLTPKGIISSLKLRDPKNTKYERMAEWGSMGQGFEWDSVKGSKEDCLDCKDLPEGEVAKGHDHRVV